MTLAIRNLIFDRVRLLLALAGVAFAFFLMNFQGSLLAGFRRAASRVIDTSTGDIWIAARGVPCFDFPNPIRSSIGSMAYGVDGVRNVRRAVSGLQFWQRPSGTQKTVVVVGMEDVGPHVPETVWVDQSDRAMLEVRDLPLEIEIGRHRARVTGTTSGFASFLGSPYVFAPYRDAARYLHLGDEQATFLIVQVAPGYRPADVQHELARRFPEADVWLAPEFAARARSYWILQTGAGGALLTAALLGFLVGAVIVSQTMYGMTMENLDEFATLKAIGASNWFIARIVLCQALLAGCGGTLLGLALCAPAVDAAKAVVGWIYMPSWLPGWIAAASLIMCCLASVASIHTALRVEPARVFRA